MWENVSRSAERIEVRDEAGEKRKTGENPVHRKTKVSRGRPVRPGLVGT